MPDRSLTLQCDAQHEVWIGQALDLPRRLGYSKSADVELHDSCFDCAHPDRPDVDAIFRDDDSGYVPCALVGDGGWLRRAGIECLAASALRVVGKAVPFAQSDIVGVAGRDVLCIDGAFRAAGIARELQVAMGSGHEPALTTLPGYPP